MVQVHLGPPKFIAPLATPTSRRYRHGARVTKVRHVMSGLPLRTKTARTIMAGFAAAALALTAAAPAANAAPVTANSTFVATPNGQVGVQQTVTIKAPRAMRNKVVTVSFTGPTGTTNAGQTIVNAQGFATIAWTPTAPGTWTVNASGLSASTANTSITVAPMSTNIVLDAANQVGVNVTTTLLAQVNANGGVIAPAGTITVRDQNNNVVATGTLIGTPNQAQATATINWTPAASTTSLTATYNPSSNAFTSSVSAPESPIISTQPTIALRFPPSIYVGVPVVLQAVPTNEIPAGWGGSGAFQIYRQGFLTFASGSQPLTNGLVSWTWTPTQTGLQTVQVQFATGNFAFNGVSEQNVNVLPAPGTDSITMNPAVPATMQAGTNVTLAGAAASGSTVTLATSGPCVINANVLTALSAGTCTVTAKSIGTGNAGLLGTSANYPVSITAAPKPPKKKKR